MVYVVIVIVIIIIMIFNIPALLGPIDNILL